MIKRVIFSCLLFLCVFASADGPDFYGVNGVTKGNHLNLRAKPTIQSEVLSYIPYNEVCLKNLGCEGGISLHDFETLSEEELAIKVKDNPRWCKIKYKNLRGWAFGKFLAEKPCP